MALSALSKRLHSDNLRTVNSRGRDPSLKFALLGSLRQPLLYGSHLKGMDFARAPRLGRRRRSRRRGIPALPLFASSSRQSHNFVGLPPNPRLSNRVGDSSGGRQCGLGIVMV